MNIHAEVFIKSKKGTHHIVQQLEKFCSDVTHWLFDKENSIRYAENLSQTIKSTGCILVNTVADEIIRYNLYESKKGQLKLASITLPNYKDIPITYYNEKARKFFDVLKKWNKNKNNSLIIEITKTDLELEDIVTAKIPRKSFDFYLKQYPLSNHPSDISRLDNFICCVFTFSKKAINTQNLKKYLLEKMKWPEYNADWCINRIETGLDILKEYKRSKKTKYIN